MKKEDQEKLLEFLEKDSTVSAEELSTQMNVPLEEIAPAIAKLESEGLICGYQAVVNWSKENDEKADALIEVKVTPQKGLGFDKIAHEIAKFDEVSAIYLMSGGYDFAVMLERKSMKEISKFVFEKLATLPSIASTATHFILKKYKDHKTILDGEESDKRIERML